MATFLSCTSCQGKSYLWSLLSFDDFYFEGANTEMFQHVDMKKKPYILQNLICGLQENSNLISVVIKMFQHNNVGMDKFLSIAKSYLWPLV